MKPSIGVAAKSQVVASLAFLCVIVNLYLCAVPMAGLIMEMSWQWTAPDQKFPEIPHSKMAQRTNSLGLSYYAPTEGNQSFDNALPCTNKSVGDIGLLNPAAGIAGGFRPMRKEAHR